LQDFPQRQEVAVNKSELIESVVEGSPSLDKKQAEVAVTAFVETVMNQTKAGNEVRISGFGIFTPTSRAARTGRNPQTGAPVKIAAAKGVRFKPAKAFTTTLNAKAAAKKSSGAKAGASKITAAAKTLAKAGTTKAPPAKKVTAAAKTLGKVPSRSAAPKKAAAKKTAKSTKKS